MKRTLKEVRDLMAELSEKRDGIRKKMKEESRSALTDAERGELATIAQSLNDLGEEERELIAEEAEANERARHETAQTRTVRPGYHTGTERNVSLSERDQQDLAGFSIGRLVSRMYNNETLDGIDAEIVAEGREEMRVSAGTTEGRVIIPFARFAQNRNGENIIQQRREQAIAQRRDLTATGGSSGSEGGLTISTTVGQFFDLLINRPACAALGATVLTGLRGNVPLPGLIDGTDPAVKAENAAADEYSPTFGGPTLSPRRLPTYVEVSNQLMQQSEINIDAMIRRNLVLKLGSLLDKDAIIRATTGLLNVSGTGAVFAGGAATNGTNANGAAPVWADIVNLFKEVAIDNADQGRLGYLTNPVVAAKLQTVEKAAGTAVFIMPEGATRLNGYNVGLSNNVPSNLTKGASSTLSGMVFGNFEDLVFGFWGGIELLVNPYIKDDSGLTRINAAVYFDSKVPRPQSFAVCKDILA